MLLSILQLVSNCSLTKTELVEMLLIDVSAIVADFEVL